MSAVLTSSSRSNERIAISALHVAFALSILFHAALLSGWLPKISLRPAEKLGEGKSGGSLAVRLAPPPAPAPSYAPPSAPASAAAPPPPRAPAPRAAPRPAPKEKLLAMERPSAPRVAPPAVAAPAPAPAPAASQPDFAATVAARRRAREAEAEPSPPSPPSQASRARLSEPPNETQQERDNRMAAINLGLNRTPSFGDEKKHGGGIFQIERVGLNDAEFFFYGWNKAIKRNSRQMIEVRRGDNPSTEIAIVRKMIAIIREHETGDFIWESHRLRREVWLSARQADNAGLEEFFMNEFFAAARRRP